MTTIAWDGRTLAGDTLCVSGHALRRECVKVFTLNTGYLFGGAGDTQELLAVKRWLEGENESKPVLGPDNGFSAILVHADGSVYRLEWMLERLPILESFHAVGSGRDFAMATMFLGGDAVKAVEVAMAFDVFTGGEVMSLDLVSLRECRDDHSQGVLNG